MINRIKLIKNKNKFLLENYNREYIIQGICFINDMFLITSYSKTSNSIISVYDKSFNFIHRCELYNNAHVGGICYDNKNDIVWITDKSGTISGFKLDDILNNDNVRPINDFVKLKVGKDLINYKNNSAVSYLTYYDGKLYMGNFTTLKKCEIRCFDILENGNIDLNSKCIIDNDFNTRVQGIFFYKDYLFVSKSTFMFLDSKLFIYKNINGKYKIFKKYNVNFDMCEQLIVVNDKLYICSESGSKIYRNKNGIDIAIINLRSIL